MHIHTLPSSTTAPHPAVCPAPIVPNAMYRRMASPTSAAPSSSGSRPTTPRPRRASSWRASSLTLTTLSAASSGTRATRRECRVGGAVCVCAARQASPTPSGDARGCLGEPKRCRQSGARHSGRGLLLRTRSLVITLPTKLQCALPTKLQCGRASVLWLQFFC